MQKPMNSEMELRQICVSHVEDQILEQEPPPTIVVLPEGLQKAYHRGLKSSWHLLAVWLNEKALFPLLDSLHQQEIQVLLDPNDLDQLKEHLVSEAIIKGHEKSLTHMNIASSVFRQPKGLHP